MTRLTRGHFLKWHWMPATVFLIGLLSIALLMWADRVKEYQRHNHIMIETIKDIQIRTSMWHLWFQEALGGETSRPMEKVLADYELALALTDAVLNGGRTEDGMLEKPLNDPELRARGKEIRSLLLKMEVLASRRMEDPVKGGIGSDLDKQFNRVYGIFLAKTTELEEIVEAERSANQVKWDRLFGGVVIVWTLIVASATLGLLNRERRRKAAEESLKATNEKLVSQAGELMQHREHLEELVDLRTGELTAANRGLELEITERRRAEEAVIESQKQLRELSSRLLTVQEEEKKKISRELHDGLGQSLTLMKIQLRSVERRLRPDQEPLKEDCEAVLLYINTVIEDVRRLSRDLCPLMLDDLGLTRALRWLIDNTAKNNDIRFDADLGEIDHLFSRNDQTAIYRIVQEILTNIMKHADARNVTVIIRQFEGRVGFFIEDDGRGFNALSVLAVPASEQGLGLKSLKERVTMLGGHLSLWSSAGEGTRISFSIPAKERVAGMAAVE